MKQEPTSVIDSRKPSESDEPPFASVTHGCPGPHAAYIIRQTPSTCERPSGRGRPRSQSPSFIVHRSSFLLLLLASLLLTACRQGMYDQPKYLPLQENKIFPDRQASRPLVPNTLPLETANLPTTLTTWRMRGQLVANMPLPATPGLLQRGRERYNIYCAPCHDQLGYGTGMIVRRGFPNATSYHLDRLVHAPDGYFYEVMTDGYGVMYSYADRVAPADRWAITAWIRVLQYSQHARREDVPADKRAELERIKP